MTQVLNPIRFAAALALAALGGTSTLADDQVPRAAAEEAAEAADQVAENAITAIDPTTGGDSLVVDPTLPTPYGVEAEAGTVSNEMADRQASRMISNPVVQDVPPATARAERAVGNDPFVIKRILPIEGTIRYGEWFWDETGAPTKGKLVVTVDLDARVVSVFRDGYEIGTAVALLGTQSHPTPIGTFPILTKEKDNVSEKYNNAPMPWTLRLTWDGIAIHGSPVMNGYASHGCIGVPDDFAEKLFAIAKRGDRVVITRGKMVGMGDKIL